MTKWVKVPAPGDFRGEGTWVSRKDAGVSDKQWNELRQTGYLPTAEGDDCPPEDSFGDLGKIGS